MTGLRSGRPTAHRRRQTPIVISVLRCASFDDHERWKVTLRGLLNRENDGGSVTASGGRSEIDRGHVAGGSGPLAEDMSLSVARETTWSVLSAQPRREDRRPAPSARAAATVEIRPSGSMAAGLLSAQNVDVRPPDS